jgi:hypothetical protein
MGCEVWTAFTGKGHKLKVPENRLLRISGPKRDEKIQNKGLHNL